MFHGYRADTAPLQQRTEKDGIAVVNLTRLKFFPCFHQLVAGGNDCRSWFAPPTITSVKPCDASKAIVAARIRSPLAKIICPSAKSHPRRRTNSPASTSTFTLMSVPWRVTSSCITIASAPCGTGAPVKIRIASPSLRRSFPIRAGRLLSNHAQPTASLARARHDCVTVHCRIIERGQRQPGEIILGCKTIERACECELLVRPAD